MIKKATSFFASHPRLRILTIILVVIIVFVVLINLFAVKKTVVSQGVPSDINTPNVKLNQTRGAAASQYQNLANQAGLNKPKETASQKTEKGQSLFSNVFSSAGKTSPGSTSTTNSYSSLTSSSNIAVSPSQLQAQDIERSERYRLESQPGFSQLSDSQQQGLVNKATEEEAAKVAAEKRQAYLSSLASSMSSELHSLKGSWTIKEQSAVKGDSGSISNNGGSNVPVIEAKPTAITAGTMMYAVLMIGIDSDQPGTPVMARLVAGKYKGARLMGSFSKEKDSLVVRFRSMLLPNATKVIGINAYAVNAKTAQIAISTSVNHHYLVRYGSLIAAAFLDGFGQYYSNNNNLSNSNACGAGSTAATCVVNYTPQAASFRNSLFTGLGQVGTQLGGVAAKQFDMPVTVKLAQGTGLGILFMSGVTINNKYQEATGGLHPSSYYQNITGANNNIATSN